MENLRIVFEFPEHMPESQIATLITGIAAYGNVSLRDEPRSFVVEVFRSGKGAKLKQLLDHDARYGFLRWNVEA